MKKNKTKYLTISIAIVFILIARTLLLRKPDHQLTFTTSKNTMVNNVTISGVYTTAAQTEVISPSKGIITELYVKNGDQVHKNDALFHVESTATTEEKALAYANYQSALNNLRIAKQNKENLDAAMWAKQKALLDAENNLAHLNDNLLDDSDNPATGDKYTELEISSVKTAVDQTKKDFYAAEKQYKEAGGNISAAQAAVAMNKLAYDATKSMTIKAPAAGKIVNLLKKSGDGVNSTSTTKIAEPVLIIANLENPTITATISEAYIPYLNNGQEAKIVFDAVRDQVFSGYIEAIDTVGTNNNGVITYNARISIKEIAPQIKPNMTAIISIETFRKEDVVSVPNSAIITKNGKTYVSKAHQKKEQLIEVKLGKKGIANTEVIDGLDIDVEILADANLN